MELAHEMLISKSNTEFWKNQPSAAAVHVDRPLTNISVAYFQEPSAFIADKVFPNVPVQKQSDLYFNIPRGEFNRDSMRKRAPGTPSAGIGYKVDTKTYFCHVYALHHPIDDQTKANYDTPLDAYTEGTQLLTTAALIRREVNWTATYFTTGIWGTDLTGVAGTPGAGEFQRWDVSTSTPVEDIKKYMLLMLQATGKKPNTLVIDPFTQNALELHPDLIERIKYGQTPGGPAIANMETLAKVFGVERILVSEAIINTAKEGQSEDNEFIAGTNALLCYVPPKAGLRTASAGYSFSWKGYSKQAGIFGQTIKRFRVELLASDLVECEMAFDQQVVAADLGIFFNGTITLA